MHLIYSRETNDILNSPNDFLFPEMAHKESSWFAGLLENIPGYTWLRIKVGRLILGPTYEMTSEQLVEYLKILAEEEQFEAERREREAEMKAQKFMAVRHPDWYWKKYIYSQKPGSEERKRAVYMFALANRREYGVYWMRRKDYGRLKAEFGEMDVKIDAPRNIVTVLTAGLEGTSRKERRDAKGELKPELIVPEQDVELFLRTREVVERTSIVGLNEPRSSVRRDTERLVAWEEVPMANAKYN